MYGMKNIKKIVVISLIVASIVNVQLFAKVRAMQSQRDFEREVAERGICVALFYDVSDKKNKDVQRMFEDVSGKTSYDNADLAFIKINSARKEFNMLKQQYNIIAVPMIILFRNGQGVVDAQGNICILTGVVSREALELFIDKYCGAEIKKLNMAKDATRAQRLKNEKKSWRLYFEPRDIAVSDYDPSQRDRE
jgi:predicted HTH domain antitoxin